MSWRKAQVCLVFCVLAALFSPVVPIVYAQDGNTAQFTAEVDELYAEIQKANATRAIYGRRSHDKIADVPYSAGFDVVEKGDKWSIVRFSEPMVPGWVSSEFLEVQRGRAVVKAEVLNVRLRPALSSKVISTVKRGYQSQVLGQRNGFVKLRLPASYPVAIRTADDDVDAGASKTQANTGVDTSVGTSVDTSEDQLTSASGWVRSEDGKQPRISDQPKAQPTSNTTSKAERQHQIAPGDAISLLVFGEPDLSIENVRVPESGSVSFPLIGPVDVADKTTAEVEQQVAKLLSQGYVNNPRLSVTIFSYRPIFIRGAVENTGSFPYTEGLTVAKAIALAGGTTDSAKPSGVSILREGETVSEGLPVDSPIQVSSGDVISVDQEVGAVSDSQAYIYVHGEVVNPGEYVYRRGLTVEKAIVLASGFNLRASKGKITVTRYAGVGENEEPKKMKRVKLYMPIEPGDIINVGASWF